MLGRPADDAAFAVGLATSSLSLLLPRSSRAPLQARRAVADAAADWGLGDRDLLQDLMLVASELATNAVRHGAGKIRLELRREAGALHVAVSDDSERMPRARTPGPYDESGRGLSILAATVSAWGVEPLGGGGKRVWARLTVR